VPTFRNPEKCSHWFAGEADHCLKCGITFEDAQALNEAKRSDNASAPGDPEPKQQPCKHNRITTRISYGVRITHCADCGKRLSPILHREIEDDAEHCDHDWQPHDIGCPRRCSKCGRSEQFDYVKMMKQTFAGLDKHCNHLDTQTPVLDLLEETPEQREKRLARQEAAATKRTKRLRAHRRNRRLFRRIRCWWRILTDKPDRTPGEVFTIESNPWQSKLEREWWDGKLD